MNRSSGLTEPQLKLARLRLAQRILISAADADPDLHVDVQWQRALCAVTGLIQKTDKARDDIANVIPVAAFEANNRKELHVAFAP